MKEVNSVNIKNDKASLRGKHVNLKPVHNSDNPGAHFISIDSELSPEELIHTEEIQDIISVPPSWLLRWGISIFFGVLALVVAASSLVSYPDVVS